MSSAPALPSGPKRPAPAWPVRGGPATPVTLPGDEHWGFPPDPDYPARLDFLVVPGDPPLPAEAAAHLIARGAYWCG